MFQSSSSRREQYLCRPPTNHRHRLNKTSFSFESKVSFEGDSGYNSTSSTPACSVASSPRDILPVTCHEEDKKPLAVNKKKYSLTPRQPDLVYSCPRPLAFPFHNDDHFLPVAEADPRDIARVTPSSINRSHSIQSKASTQYDSGSSFSRQSSILSSIQKGTVRSIRSVFQIPSSLNAISQSTKSASGSYSTRQPPLERLEIKKGTVQSLKALFMGHQQQAALKSVPPLCANQGQASQSQASQPKAPITNSTKDSSCTHVSNSAATKKSLSSRAKEMAKRAFRKKPIPINTEQQSIICSKADIKTTHISPAIKPLPKKPIVETVFPEQPKKTLISEAKRLSTRVVSSIRPSKSSNLTPPSKAKNNEGSTDDQSKTPKQEGSKVGKLWNSFKNLMAGKRSRVGVL
ncbi:hypothetical protein BY458DRAFT_465239 [Sporodiniella umbellata]|nr:hypothetical protein BY458DRAFT_465239 [Sporodiniella umbellata]